MLWCIGFLAGLIHAGGVPAQTIRRGHYGAPSLLAPFVAPSCPLAVRKALFKRAWELASSETAALLCAAEKALGALDGVELGSPRSVSVAEALLCTELCGPRFVP